MKKIFLMIFSILVNFCVIQITGCDTVGGIFSINGKVTGKAAVFRLDITNHTAYLEIPEIQENYTFSFDDLEDIEVHYSKDAVFVETIRGFEYHRDVYDYHWNLDTGSDSHITMAISEPNEIAPAYKGGCFPLNFCRVNENNKDYQIVHISIFTNGKHLDFFGTQMIEENNNPLRQYRGQAITIDSSDFKSEPWDTSKL